MCCHAFTGEKYIMLNNIRNVTMDSNLYKSITIYTKNSQDLGLVKGRGTICTFSYHICMMCSHMCWIHLYGFINPYSISFSIRVIDKQHKKLLLVKIKEKVMISFIKKIFFYSK